MPFTSTTLTYFRTTPWLQQKDRSFSRETTSTPQTSLLTPRKRCSWALACDISHQARSCPPSQDSSSQIGGRTRYGLSTMEDGYYLFP